jgi:hypothetical protein
MPLELKKIPPEYKAFAAVEEENGNENKMNNSPKNNNIKDS